MAEEFQAAICEGNWWSNITASRSVFPLGSSPCSVAAHDAGSYSSWQNDIVSDSSLGFLDLQKPQQSETVAQMVGFGLSSPSPSSNWNQSLLESAEGESHFQSVVQEESGIDSSSAIQIGAFKPMNQEFSLDQQSLSCVTTSAGNSTVTGQGLSGNFPVGSASYEYPPSTLIQSLLYETDHQIQPQNSLFTNQSMAYNSSSTANYGSSSNEILPFLKPSVPKQLPAGLMHFSNNTPFWNASAEGRSDIKAGVFPSSSQPKYQSPTIEEKPNCPSMNSKSKREEIPDSASAVKKNICEAALKRPRIETPSPLPTFKVRKEKLGDRITALQQLVSPFGKTDTASVLHEAIEYIKFLHDQVNALSTPYLKNGASNIQHRQVCETKESEGGNQDLRSRGLCLVPISSTFPVANETTADFWTPTFGGGLMS